jgi:hypothetical protein
MILTLSIGIISMNTMKTHDRHSLQRWCVEDSKGLLDSPNQSTVPINSQHFDKSSGKNDARMFAVMGIKFHVRYARVLSRFVLSTVMLMHEAQ